MIIRSFEFLEETHLASRLASLGALTRRGVPGALFPPLLFVPTSVPRFLLKSPTWEGLRHNAERY